MEESTSLVLCLQYISYTKCSNFKIPSLNICFVTTKGQLVVNVTFIQYLIFWKYYTGNLLAWIQVCDNSLFHVLLSFPSHFTLHESWQSCHF